MWVEQSDWYAGKVIWHMAGKTGKDWNQRNQLGDYGNNSSVKWVQHWERYRTEEGVTSSRRGDRSFISSSPHKALILKITHKWEYLCSSLGVQQKSSSISLEQKNMTLCTYMRIRMVSLSSHHPTLRRLSAKRDSLGPWLPWRKLRALWMREYKLPQLYKTLPKRPTYFSPHTEYWGSLYDCRCGRG